MLGLFAYSSYLIAYQALYPDTFRIVFRHMPLPSIHDLAYISSMAAEAAGAQGMFWEMYETALQPAIGLVRFCIRR